MPDLQAEFDSFSLKLGPASDCRCVSESLLKGGCVVAKVCRNRSPLSDREPRRFVAYAQTGRTTMNFAGRVRTSRPTAMTAD